MHVLGIAMHRSLGVDVGLIGAPRWKAVVEFDSPDFYDAVAIGVVEAGRLGIEDDLTHGLGLLRELADASAGPPGRG